MLKNARCWCGACPALPVLSPASPVSRQLTHPGLPLGVAASAGPSLTQPTELSVH